MKVENVKMKAGVFLAAILVCGILGVYLYENLGGGNNKILNESEQTFLLVKPVFGQSSETTFLDEEAGLSIYVNIGRSIDLTVAKTVYRTIEKETSNYTVGSVALPGLSENEDVHCFVHKNGWIVTYYLKAEPVSKIVDWKLWSGDKLTSNKLRIGLERMTSALGVVVTSLEYYHFQYPDADKCMVILETIVGSGEDSFNITIPSGLTVYERSWSHYSEYSGWPHWSPETWSHFRINGNTVNNISSVDPTTERGILTIAQLIPDVTHIVSISGNYADKLYGACIALAYQEP